MIFMYIFKKNIYNKTYRKKYFKNYSLQEKKGFQENSLNHWFNYLDGTTQIPLYPCHLWKV